MTEHNYDQIRTRFWDAYVPLRDLSDEEILSGPHEVFETAYEQLKDLGTANTNGATETILSNSYAQNVAVRLIHVIEMIEQRFELDEARLVNAGADAWESLKTLPSYPAYLQLVKREYEGAELKKGDKVVFLGSGPLPITAILFYQEHGVESVGIERNPLYAELSQHIVNSLGLGDHIKIIEGDHFSLPLREKHELLILAYRAEPKEEIFEHLSKTLEDKARVAYRVPGEKLDGHPTLFDLLSLVQQDTYFKPDAIHPGFKEYYRVQPEPPAINALVLTIKETVATASR